LVLRPGALGDTLLAVPALRALRRAFESVRLAAHPGAARLLETIGEVDRGFAFDGPSLTWLFDDTSPTDAVVAWMGSTPALRSAAVLAPSRPPRMDRHCAQYLLETLAPLGIDLAWDDDQLAVTGIDTDEVLIHPGSGSPTKNWPAAHFASVIRHMDVPVRLVVGEADAEAAAAVDTCLGERVPRLERLSLEALAARLAGCRAYVGNDSGVSHLAGLCGAHCVVLFGPTDPRVWRPLGPGVHVLPFDAEPAEIAAFVRRQC
jgi:ADP-heptose:LPS heptosyltransferase